MPFSARAGSGRPNATARSSHPDGWPRRSASLVLRRGTPRPQPIDGSSVAARMGTGLLAALGLSLLLAACGGKPADEQAGMGEESSSPGAQPLAEAVQTLVNQGNQAHREGRYAKALGFYREAMAGAPGHPVPQFGALMAALALGDSALADSLRVQLSVTAPELLDMLHPDGSMGPRTSLPPGHPPVEKPGGGVP